MIWALIVSNLVFAGGLVYALWKIVRYRELRKMRGPFGPWPVRPVEPGQFDADLPRRWRFPLARSVGRADAVLQAHSAEFVQGVQESGNFLGSLLQVVNRHNKQVSQSRAARRTIQGANTTLPAKTRFSGIWGRKIS